VNFVWVSHKHLTAADPDVVVVGQPGHAVDITARIDRRQVLGDLISEYRRAA
jgi:hypothetical protein